MSNYYFKYLKYKNKYLDLQNKIGGGLGLSKPVEDEYTSALNLIIELIKAGKLKHVAEGGNGKVYIHTLLGYQFVVKALNIENGKKEIARYKMFEVPIIKCKGLNYLASKEDEKVNYILYEYGGESLNSWISKNTSVDFIPLLLQIIHQMRCFDSNDTIHLDIKPENIVVNKLDLANCKDCTICGGYLVKAGHAYLARLIDLTSLYKKSAFSSKLTPQEQSTLYSLSTVTLNNPVEIGLLRFIENKFNFSNLVSLTGIAFTLLYCILASSNPSIGFKDMISFGTTIMSQMADKENATRLTLLDIGYKTSSNRDATEFSIVDLFMWLSPGEVKLELFNGANMKRGTCKELSNADFRKLINNTTPVFRKLFGQYLLNTFKGAFSSNTKASHVIHILGRCCHMDPSQRYTLDELEEELYRYGKKYTASLAGTCNKVKDSPKLFNEARDIYV